MGIFLRRLCFSVFVLIHLNINAQTSVLSQFNFDKHNYKFYFFPRQDTYKFNDSSHHAKPFLVINKSKLNDLKKAWVGKKKTDEQLWCGYDYTIFIIEDEKILGQLDVNTKCGEVIGKGIGTSYNFDKYDPFTNLIGDFRVYDTTLTANTITKVRQLYKDITNAENIYYPIEKIPEWLRYDGSFNFVIDSKRRQKNDLRVHNKIRTKYKNKTFALDYLICDNYRYWGQIICDSVVYNEIKKDIPKWHNYQFSISDDWKPLNFEENNYSPFIFTEDKNKLDKLIKTAASSAYILLGVESLNSK